VEPIGKWTVVELRAELERLDLGVSGNKQELYQRLLDMDEIEEDWEDEPEDEGFDFTEMGLTALRTAKRYRVPIAAVLIVTLLVGAMAFGGRALLDLLKEEEAVEAQVHMWEFTLEERNLTNVQTMFVEDGDTETISVLIPAPKNLSSVYIGVYWQETDEQPGGIVGCDQVTVVNTLTDVNKTNLYTLSSTEATSQECDADGTEPWDHIWYQYDLDLPNVTSFEGTEEEALAVWDAYTGIGTGEWFIEISVDTYATWGPVCDCEDGEEVRLTVSTIEYEVAMSTVAPDDD
jgi:hypothetical protein